MYLVLIIKMKTNNTERLKYKGTKWKIIYVSLYIVKKLIKKLISLRKKHEISNFMENIIFVIKV